MYDSIIEKIDMVMTENQWERDYDDEWTKTFVLDDPSRYIGEYPLETILSGKMSHVYGTGAQGVAAFCAESLRTEIEENMCEYFGLSQRQCEWIDSDEYNWESISSYIQGWISPKIDIENIAQWLESIGYSQDEIYPEKR